MVVPDAEGAHATAEHLDLAGRVRLHPEGRLRGTYVAQERTEDEFGHTAEHTRRGAPPRQGAPQTGRCLASLAAGSMASPSLVELRCEAAKRFSGEALRTPSVG